MWEEVYMPLQSMELSEMCCLEHNYATRTAKILTKSTTIDDDDDNDIDDDCDDDGDVDEDDVDDDDVDKNSNTRGDFNDYNFWELAQR